jgi:hypothetical protein
LPGFDQHPEGARAGTALVVKEGVSYFGQTSPSGSTQVSPGVKEQRRDPSTALLSQCAEWEDFDGRDAEVKRAVDLRVAIP